jgi:hypothetical protein
MGIGITKKENILYGNKCDGLIDGIQYGSFVTGQFSSKCHYQERKSRIVHPALE